MGIRQEIAQWDGKSANDIADIYQRHCGAALFMSVIIALIADVSLQKGTT